ncbi:MAG: hypothetical protein ACYTGN_18130 [Planctomycetota bacterium]|jgi:hypothetical protein
MRRSIPVATLLLAAACGTLGRGSVLSYAQYQSLTKGLDARAVISAFGEADDLMEHEGKITGLTYRCENANGKTGLLRLGFDKAGKLSKWVLKDR